MLFHTVTFFFTFSDLSEILIEFNQIDVIVGKSLVKHIYCLFLLISFEEPKKSLIEKYREGGTISIKVMLYTSVNSNMFEISEVKKKLRILIMR